MGNSSPNIKLSRKRRTRFRSVSALDDVRQIAMQLLETQGVLLLLPRMLGAVTAAGTFFSSSIVPLAASAVAALTPTSTSTVLPVSPSNAKILAAKAGGMLILAALQRLSNTTTGFAEQCSFLKRRIQRAVCRPLRSCSHLAAFSPEHHLAQRMVSVQTRNGRIQLSAEQRQACSVESGCRLQRSNFS